MPDLTAAEISRLLREIGDHMVLQGGNPYRAKAYSRAADNLALSTISIAQLIAENRLKEIPGIGDAVSTLISLYIVREARELGAPRHLVWRMLANVALDGMVGVVPLVGDAFDVMWRANRRNVKLLRDHLTTRGELP